MSVTLRIESLTRQRPPIAVTGSGIAMLAKDLHSAKAAFRIAVTERGIVTLTELGIVMLVKDLQPQKALAKSSHCCNWHTTLHCTWPLFTLTFGCFLSLKEDPNFREKIAHVQLFVPVLSWDWSPLGFIRGSTGTNVCDFENWIFDPAKAPNSRHRFRDCDACQRLALCKGSLPNSRHWTRDCDPHRIRDSDAGQRSSAAKGTCEELTLLQLTHYTPLYVAAFHADIWVFFESQRRPKFQRENRPRTALCSSTFVRLKPAGLHSRKYWNKCLWLGELNLWPQRTAILKGTVLNGGHRGRDSKTCQRPATCKGRDTAVADSGVMLAKDSQILERRFSQWPSQDSASTNFPERTGDVDLE